MSTTNELSPRLSGRQISRMMAAISPTGCTRPDSLFGAWAIEPTRFAELVEMAKGVDLVKLAEKRAAALAKAGLAGRSGKIRADGAPSGPLPTLSPETPGKKKSEDEDDGAEMDGPFDDDQDDDQEDDDDQPYQLVNGIAVISMTGPMTKYSTSFQSIFGGCSTIAVRQALRQAARDPRVNCAVLAIDSPGGTSAGTSDLAADIRTFENQKPCYAYISDSGCSAAYWAASQCTRIYANDSANVGCIGTMAILTDTSKKMEQKGVTVHVVSSDTTGQPMKGAGAPGTPITDDQLADFKRIINETNDLFVADVATGRNLNPSNVRAIADGRIHVGAKAQSLGLVDEIASFDSAMQAIYQENYQMNSEQFKSFAAANPEDPAVKNLLAQGVKLGKADGRTESRTEMATLLAAFPGREAFAAAQFAKGNDVLSAKAELADVLMVELAAAKKTPPASPSTAGDNPAIRLASPEAVAQNAGASPDAAISAFETAWKEKAKAGGMRNDAAIAAVVRERPDLHQAYVAAMVVKSPSRQRA